ncbi:MAG: LPS assembly protein LptD [Desulfobacteraceae bacterium]
MSINILFKNKCGYHWPTLLVSVKPFAIISIGLASIFLSSILVPCVTAKDLKDIVNAKTSDLPWSISADNMSYDQEKSLVMGSGNVVIERDSTRLTANRVTFDPNAMIAQAKGEVNLSTGKDHLSCQRLDLNLKTESGTIYQGSVFLSEGHFYLKGEKIEKTGKQTYFAEKATVTTCDGDHPDWKLTARKLNITVEGYGTASHTALWAKSMPVLYSPFIVFPVKTKRQTGLLTPHMGQNDRKGLTLEQPFFWAINDQSDMTLNVNYMEKRGYQYGLEYRYLLGSNAKGMIMLDSLEDDKIDDGSSENSRRWGYTDDSLLGLSNAGNRYIRPNSDRYWFRMKHDQPLGAGYMAKLDLDIISDQDYLAEFKNTQTGFNLSQEAFENFFGRGVDDYTDITRSNTINLAKTWTHYNLNAGAKWTDHVVNRNLNFNDPTVQYLPEINFEGSKHKLGKTPLHFALASQYTYLYRQDTTSAYTATNTHRMDAYPRISLPFNLGNVLSIEPSLGARETMWTATEDDTEEEEETETQNRELWDARIDMSNGFYRIYKPKIGAIDRIKHDIKPKVSYQYLPRVNQDDYPLFDRTDRIPSKNLITYSLTNTLTYRKHPQPMPKDKAPNAKAPAPSYRQFARLKLEQSYDLSDGDDPYINLQYNEDTGNTEEVYSGDYPFSEISAELELTPLHIFSIDSDAKWSVYDGQFKAANAAFSLWSQRQDKFTLEYRFAERTALATDNTKESLVTTANLKLTNQLQLFGLWERDFYTDTDLEYGGGIFFSAQCWALRVSHIVEEDDHRYTIAVDLYGLGKLGS